LTRVWCSALATTSAERLPEALKVPRATTAMRVLDEAEVAEFVTLNYDLFLDRALEIYGSASGMDWYVDRSRMFRLYKLHGSVNWGRRLLGVPPGSLGSGVDPFVQPREFCAGTTTGDY
jgi:hypothetical protein